MPQFLSIGFGTFLSIVIDIINITIVVMVSIYSILNFLVLNDVFPNLYHSRDQIIIVH